MNQEIIKRLLELAIRCQDKSIKILMLKIAAKLAQEDENRETRAETHD